MILEQAPGGTYHISAYDEKETREVVEEILRVMGKPRSLIEEVPDRAGYDLVYSIDSRNLRSLGWKPEVSFREGIECILNQST
jgi:dTDP-glucose 4,6-dehydratase